MANVTQDGILVKEMGSVKIYLSGGKFHAEVNGKWISKRTQGDIEKEISKVGSPITVMEAFKDNISIPHTIEIVGVETKKSGYNTQSQYRHADGNLTGSYTTFYKLDRGIIAEIKALRDRKKAADAAFLEEYRDIFAKLIPLKEGDVINMLHAARIAAQIGAEVEAQMREEGTI